MDKFNIEMENDDELTDLLWINYLENRNFREISAKKKWNELFNGSVENYSDLKLIGMNSLNRFKEFTIGNEKFCTQLIKKYFKIVKEKYNPLAEKKNEELKIYNNENPEEFINNEDEYFKMLENINNQVEIEFAIEYEKMLRIQDIFDDVSLFSQVGWDLSKFTKEDMFIISKLNDALVNRKEITEFLEKIGKNERTFGNTNKESLAKSSYYTNEYIGISLDNNLSKLLPSELTGLKNPLLRKLFYLKYIEKRLLNYSVDKEYEKSNRKINIIHNNGPIIVCIDTSSSMNGLPEEIAKSITLYILKSAYKIKREVYLISFGSVEEIIEFNLTNEKNGLLNVLNFLKKKFNGGTDFVTPLKRSFSLINNNNFKYSDILFITDGLGKLPLGFINEIKSEKDKNNTIIFSILLNSKETKIEFSDENLYYEVKGASDFKGVLSVYDKIGHYEFLDNN